MRESLLGPASGGRSLSLACTSQPKAIKLLGMMKRTFWIAVAVALWIAAFGWNPFADQRDTSGILADGYTEFETGVHRQPNGVYRVRALTRMPNVKAEMVRWWFADYMQTTEHYQRWHPTDHVWMDWENKSPGQSAGASHLVHEYIGGELSKLRIQFADPEEVLGRFEEREERLALCGRAGLLEEPLNISTMCHVVRDTEWGAEMRSVFWLGHVSAREGNRNVFSIAGLLGNTFLVRQLVLDDDLAVDLMTHAIEEMGYLADFLPELYAAENSRGGPSERASVGERESRTQPRGP